jgi:P4 family phage/plasmid primase-like protien
MKFSIYKKPVQNIYPAKEITIQEFVTLVRSDTYKKISDKAKELKKGKPEILREYKAKQFDYITVAGTFTKRAKSAIKELSGYYAADIDDIDNVEEIRKELINDPYTHVLFTSPSGGIKVIIKIPKKEIKDFELYVEAYYEYLDEQYNIKGKLDKKTKDPARACFVSHDSKCHYNKKSETWEEKKEYTPLKATVKVESYPSYSETTLKAMLKKIPCRGWGQHTFQTMLSLIHYGEYRQKDYFGVFRWWVTNYDGTISVEDMQERWNEYKKKKTERPLTIKSLLKEAKEHGYENPENKKVNLPSGVIRVDNYLDNVKMYYKEEPFFFEKTKQFWFWNTELSKWEECDEIDLMNGIEEALNMNGMTVTGKVKNNYLESFKRVGRKNHPDKPVPTWVQFKNKIVDVKTGEEHKPDPKYWLCNPIPFNVSDSEETPEMDKLFESWVGKEKVKNLYEIIAYSCISDYPIHRWFCLLGTGCNGKGTFMNLMLKFFGMENITSSDLDFIGSNNFAAYNLYKKSVCFMGETNLNALKSTAMLKKLCGQDPVSFEKKGKTAINDINYAKIIVASNSLPITHDKTDGFYRRFFHIDFPNTFSGKEDVLSKIPEEEYENLARKCCFFSERIAAKKGSSQMNLLSKKKGRCMRIKATLLLVS